MIITKNNWIETSLSQRTANNLCDFTITVNPHPFAIDSFENNSIRVAKEISEKYDNVHLLFSGGSDSQYIMRTFIEQKLPITPVLAVTPYNRYELEYAVDFLKSHNVKPLIYKYDKKELFQTVTNIAYRKGYYSLLASLTIDLCNKVNAKGGTVLNAAGDGGFQIDSSNNVIFQLNEWGFYINYIPNNIGSFFIYDIAIQFSRAKEFEFIDDYPRSKCKLYKMEYRDKRGPHAEFWQFFNKLKLNINKFSVKLPLEQYKQILTGNKPFTIT